MSNSSPVDKFNSQDKCNLNIFFTKTEIERGEKILNDFGIDSKK